MTITATGSYFISSSTIAWNGAALATTHVSASSLQATVPQTALASAGSANVTVQTPAPGGGISGAVVFTVNQGANPAPVLTSISPATASVGSSAIAMTVTGQQFVSASVVQWNGTALPTTYVSSTSLTAQVPASDLAASGTATVTVLTPGGGNSGGLTFTVKAAASSLAVVDVEGSDIVWDAKAAKLYVSVPASAPTNGNTITVVDPITGQIAKSQALSSEPSVLAISDDSQFLYAGVNTDPSSADEATEVQRLALPALTPDILINSGGLSNYNRVVDMKVKPGAAHTLAVTLQTHPQLVIFDDTAARSKSEDKGSYGSIQWKADGTEIWGGNGSFTRASVTAAGASFVTSYYGAFRNGGLLQSDPTTGYIYATSGMAVDSATGLPVGSFAQMFAGSSPTNSVPWTGLLLAVDPVLKRAFSVRQMVLSSSQAGFEYLCQVESHDLNTYAEISEVQIVDCKGQLANLVRWGSSGLAIISKRNGDGPGKLYLLDGAFVNPGAAPEMSAGTPTYLVPTISTISPMHATLNSDSVGVTITGHDFNRDTTGLFWQGSSVPVSLPVTIVSSTEMQATIPGSLLKAKGLAGLSATTGPGMQFDAVQFPIDPALPTGTVMDVYNAGGNDVAWDGTAQKLYVSVPGSQGDYGNTIAIVDPVAHTEGTQGFIASEPNQLSISSDGKFLYAGFNGNNTVKQYNLPGFTVSNSWNLGLDPDYGASYAREIEAAPGGPHTTAISLGAFDTSASVRGVTIYDDGAARPIKLTSYVEPVYQSLQWGATAATLYAEDLSEPSSFYALGVNSSGVSVSNTVHNLTDSTVMHFDSGNGLMYTVGGQVFDPAKGTAVGSYAPVNGWWTSGVAVPDSAQNRVFFLDQTQAQSNNSSNNWTLQVFDQQGFNLLSSLTIENVVGKPTALIRWGTNGVAFTTRVGHPADGTVTGPGRLYVITGAFVNPAVPASASAPTRFIH